MTPGPGHIGDALAEAARTMDGPHTVQETLDAVVRAAVKALPSFEHVGISVVHRNGKVETRAATDRLVWDLDALQNELNEGPCLEAIKDEDAPPSVVVEHMDRERRWPRYAPRAAQAGVRSQLGIQLSNDRQTFGGLNLYSTSSGTVAPDAHHLADLFATHAALALGRARREDQLSEGMMSRKLIGQVNERADRRSSTTTGKPDFPPGRASRPDGRSGSSA